MVSSLRRAQRAIAGEGRQIDEMRRRLKQGRQRLLRIGDGMRPQLRQPLRRAALARRRAQIEEAAAADGALRRGVAQHEAVAFRRGDRPVKHQLHRRLAARRDRRVAKQHDARADFGRGVMQPHRHPLRDRLRLGGEQAQGRVDAVGRRVQLGIEHHVAARDGVLADAVAGEIERAALAGDARVRSAGSAHGSSARAPPGPTG